MEESSKKIIIIAITFVVIISLVSIISGIYIGYNANILKNNEEQTNNIQETQNNDSNKKDDSTNKEFDFDELLATLHTSVQEEKITTFLTKCEVKNTNSENPPETKIENISVSNATINIIVDKLKTAQSIDKDITYSWFGCPPKSITYYISINSSDPSQIHSEKVFSLNYANDDNILLVEYKDKGYAFHFNSSEEINNFIESLE